MAGPKSRFVFLVLVLALLGGCARNGIVPAVAGAQAMPNSAGPSKVLRGTVRSAGRPISGARVVLYRAGSNGPRTGAVLLGSSVADSRGAFALAYPVQPASAVLYAVASGGNAGAGTNAAISLIALPRGNALLTIDEFSTVAVSFALAQFSDASGREIGASSTNAVGIANAVELAQTNLVTTSGMPSTFWPPGTQCTGSETPANCEGLERIDALSNALAACVRSASPVSMACSALFQATQAAAENTLAAVHAIALDPSNHAAAVFALSRSVMTYVPAIGDAPSAWTIGLKYTGNGKEFDGPGNMAIDARGNVWITNNYVYNADPSVPVCGGKQLLELTPLGVDAPGAPFSGGGVNGAGFGIALDLAQRVWVGNFGFVGTNCKHPLPADSVSEFDASGNALSPVRGDRRGSIDAPQGLATDRNGDLWIVNNGGNSVTIYPDANPRASKTIGKVGVKPFDVAIDSSNVAWVTGTFSNSVLALSADGKVEHAYHSGFDHPLGVAVDARDRIWVDDQGGKSVTLIDRAGVAGTFTGGGIAVPWGIAIDGNGNAWVANFSGRSPRVSELCGGGACPRHLTLGQPISPSPGYASALLMRLTGIAVDAAGNLWVADNWQKKPQLTNPGGDAVVEFVGIAAPVKTPLLGPPRQP